MFHRIPHRPLTDRQWAALRPYVERDAPQGRPMADLRHRMNGMFWLLTTDAPWREVPPEYGEAGTVARHFRRLTKAGVWEELLQALADLGPRHPLQSLRRVIFRGARRAYRMRGMGIIVLARRLKFLGALPGPAWMLPDPDLSKRLVALQMRHRENFGRFVLQWGRALRNLMGMVGGRAHIPRSLRLAMA
ncbi:transposase [Sediminicoccus sp. KRV36]|uniref:transposase n=1 Tax=Sediminicoccus sp. KRV36 TaxID=3133721 RepID=UPI00200DE9E5|nr:transposase [Sediminicoccus rosea]UPY38052.1 transposase [Sediminicoccus rosea]